MITIGYSKSAQNTKAFALIVEGWNELVQDGMTPDAVSFPDVNADTEVLYASSANGELVGCLLWHHCKTTQTFDVVMAYVEPSSRKKGVFRTLMDDLKKLSKQRGVSRVTIQIGAGNEIAEEVIINLGGYRIAMIYEV